LDTKKPAPSPAKTRMSSSTAGGSFNMAEDRRRMPGKKPDKQKFWILNGV
jgi:hypothetical protein